MHEQKNEVWSSKFQTLLFSVFRRLACRAFLACLARHALFVILATGFVLGQTAGTIAAIEPSADSLMQQGLHAYQRGSFYQALAAWKQAADLYERDGKVREQSRALAQAAQASESLGQVSQALQQLELALTLAQQTGDRARIAAVMESLGRTYLAARKPDAAVQYLTQALAMAQTDKDRRLIAAIHNDLGIAHVAQQHNPEALAAFASSAQEAQAVGDRHLSVRAYINAARMALKLNQPDQARNWLDLAFDALKDFEPSHDKAMSLIQVGLGYQQLRASMPAMNAPLLLRAAGVLLEATTVAEHVGDARTRSYAEGYLGHLYESEHRYDEALQLTRQPSSPPSRPTPRSRSSAGNGSSAVCWRRRASWTRPLPPTAMPPRPCAPFAWKSPPHGGTTHWPETIRSARSILSWPICCSIAPR